MSLISRLFGSAADKNKPAAAASDGDGRKAVSRSSQAGAAADRGFLLFEQTGEVIAAEQLLREHGYAVEIKGPPPQLRRGCDMVLVCPLMLHTRITSVLTEAGLKPMEYVPVTDPLLEPVSFFQTTDYGDWLMVRAANMKVTVRKSDGLIVNISGGGCPDVPYLANLLTGRRLSEADEPRLHGRTLCSYALQRAFEEAGRLCRG